VCGLVFGLGGPDLYAPVDLKLMQAAGCFDCQAEAMTADVAVAAVEMRLAAETVVEADEVFVMKLLDDQ